jgi:hypothetical protein
MEERRRASAWLVCLYGRCFRYVGLEDFNSSSDDSTIGNKIPKNGPTLRSMFSGGLKRAVDTFGCLRARKIPRDQPTG